MSITSESYWGREIVTDALNNLFRRCCEHFNSDPLGGGTKGNKLHTTGRHRSREFCLLSAFSTDRTYGTTDKRDRDGNPRYIRAMDVKLTPTQMRDVCHRLDNAVRAGRLPQVAEWFGTFDNRNVVGWYEGHPSSSDDSHLEHVHVGLWTVYADDVPALDGIYDVMTGDDMSEAFPAFGDKGEGVKRVQGQLNDLGYKAGTVDGVYGTVLQAAVKKFRAKYLKPEEVGDGKKVTGWMTRQIDKDLRDLDAKPGPAGPAGETGPAGPPGKDAVAAGTVLTLDAFNATVTAVSPPAP
jgi:hypothetical protein